MYIHMDNTNENQSCVQTTISYIHQAVIKKSVSGMSGSNDCGVGPEFPKVRRPRDGVAFS